MKFYSIIDSPLGKLTLQASNEGLTGLWMEITTTQPTDLGEWQPNHPILQQAENELARYFANEINKFSVPIAAKGTDFQKSVWHQLTRIDFGETRSYQDIANAIGNPKAVRAVGLANGKNPISIIVPCHRVIGKDGKLTGYAGGVDRKQWLLKHEGVS